MSISLFKETVIKGVPLSGGIAVARVCRFNEHQHSNLDVFKVKGEGAEKELARVRRAVKIAVERLDVVKQEAVAKIGAAEAEIFTVQKMILEDHALIKKIERLILDDNASAEAAVMTVLDSFEERLRAVDNEYMRERVSDLGEIKRRLLDVLSNINPEFQCADKEHCQRGVGRIVVAEELTPRLTMELDSAHTLGFVTEHGGVNSHAAILARALGIPAVSGIKGIHGEITCGTELVVNGNTGEVIISPTEKTVSAIKESRGTGVRVPKAVDPVSGFAVMANISLASEVAEAQNMKAEGIGLYRTEFEFMVDGRFLDENEQYVRYAAVMKAMKGLPVTFRLFDAGGDKPLPFLDMREEENPALGWRGGRLLLGEGTLLSTQARAIAMASRHGPVDVLYPMIVDVNQFLALRDMFEQAVKGMDTRGIRHGVMFEVPSACIQADALFDAADFGSVGTNDLIQYLFAVDRNNDRVAYDYSPDREALWVLMESMSVAARKTGKPLSVCGEVAGNPQYVARLIDMGITSVSVSARLISDVRHAALATLEKRV